MDKAAIYQKSERGAEAIATRSSALHPKQRSMLILINGKRGYDELAQLGQGLGDPAQLMAQLEELGLIEPGPAAAGAAPGPGAGSAASAPRSKPAAAPVAAPVPPPAPAKPAPAPLNPTQLAVPLPQAQRFAVRRLTDLLGPAADDLCMRIENAKTPQEFRAAIRRTETVLREVVGPQLAEQFTAAVENLQP